MSQIAVSWTDTSGHVWDLRDASSGVWLGTQTKGLHTPVVERHTSELHNVAGSWWRGQRTRERHVILEVHISADTPEAWAELNRQFWDGMDPGKTGTITVQAPGQPQRRLTARPVLDDGQVWERDPAQLTHSVYAAEWVAENPHFEGETHNISPSAQFKQPFLPTEGRDDSLYISASSGTAQITIAGDAPAFATWTLTGAIEGIATLTIGAESIVIPGLSLADGEQLIIKTDPAVAGLFDSSGNRLPNTATEFTMAPLPVGTTDVFVDVGLQGSVTLTFAEQFRRGW